MDTLLLTTAWDLTTDAQGDIALATGHYAVAQDVASAVRTFQGEVWYDTTAGVPYLQSILGKRPPLGFVKAKLIAAGLTVPTVAKIVCFLTGPGVDRQLGGQLQIYNADGVLAALVTATTFQGGLPYYVSAVSSEAAGVTYLTTADGTLLVSDSGAILTWS